MHNAPSVTYPVGRSRFQAGLLLGLWLTGAAAVAVWRAQVQVPVWQLGATLLLLMVAGLGAIVSWRQQRAGTLCWDGEIWTLAVTGQDDTGSPAVGLDLQHWLLLRWTGAKAARWLWLERADRQERWADLRRAVYSRARPQALRNDPSAAAKS